MTKGFTLTFGQNLCFYPPIVTKQGKTVYGL
jgi:hypothetical protein